MINYNIRTFLQSVKNTSGEPLESRKVLIRVRWNHKKEEMTIYTGYFADASKWDNAHQLPKNNTSHIQHNGERVSAADIRSRIEKYISVIDECFKEFDKDEVLPNKSEMRYRFFQKIGIDDISMLGRMRKGKDDTTFLEHKIRTTLLDYFDEFVEYSMSHDKWKKSSWKKYHTLRGLIEQFNRFVKVEKVTTNTLDDYLHFLVSKGYHNSSIKDSFKRLRQFFSWCYLNHPEIVKDKRILEYEVNLSDVANKMVIFLTEDEYQKVKRCWLPPDRQVLHNVKNLFLFQCNTGLRFSDMFNLTKNQITDDAIIITAQKTGKETKIYLNNTSKSILEEYKDIPFKDNKALPVMSNQKMNVYIKELCWRAGIDAPTTISYKVGKEIKTETHEKWELIGTHCGRRTFVSLSILYGASPEEVRRITGHSCYKAMEPYIGISDKQRKNATDVFDKANEREKVLDKLKSIPLKKLEELLKKV